MKRIPLRARDGTTRVWALVDDADFEWLNQWRWSLSSTGYVERGTEKGGRKRLIRLHRVILGLEPGDPRMGEHEDRNPLNCQRSNLRIAERGHADNKQNLGLHANNTSGFRGVYWHKQRRKWAAKVMLDYRAYHLGLFATPEEADAVVKAWRAEHMPFSEDVRVA